MIAQYDQILARHSAGLQANFSGDDLAEIHVRRSTLLSLVGRHEGALADSSASIQLRPTYVPAYFRSGHALFQLGRYDEAAEVLREGMRYSPGNQQLQHAFRSAVMEHNCNGKGTGIKVRSPPRKQRAQSVLATRSPPPDDAVAVASAGAILPAV